MYIYQSDKWLLFTTNFSHNNSYKENVIKYLENLLEFLEYKNFDINENEYKDFLNSRQVIEKLKQIGDD